MCEGKLEIEKGDGGGGFWRDRYRAEKEKDSEGGSFTCEREYCIASLSLSPSACLSVALTLQDR